MGLRQEHDAYDMAAAVMEGVAFLLRKNCDSIRKAGSDIQYIIATGGGLPMREGNSGLLKELGTVIYLKAETDTLVKRLSGSTTRPLLQSGDLREKIETMLAIRGPVYEACADLILQTDNMSFYEIICNIERLLAK